MNDAGSNQAFTLDIFFGAAPGTYDNILTGQGAV